MKAQRCLCCNFLCFQPLLLELLKEHFEFINGTVKCAYGHRDECNREIVSRAGLASRMSFAHDLQSLT